MTSVTVLMAGSVAILVLAVPLLVRTLRGDAEAYLYYRRPIIGGVGRRPINKDLFRIGRQAGNELRLRERTVSRFHAEIVRNHNGTHFIRDLDSSNGLMIGNRRVNSSLLKDGDVIALGSVRLKFVHYARKRKPSEDTVMADSHEPARFAIKRRRSQRQPVTLRHAHVYSDVSGWVGASVRDLSEDGALVDVEQPLDLRTPVDLVFPIRNEEQRRWLRVTGEVARAHDHSIGIAFLEIDNRSRDLLRAVLAHRMHSTELPVQHQHAA